MPDPRHARLELELDERNRQHPNRPQRKWFAAAVGALAVQLLAAIGVDVGELGSSALDLVGIGQDPDAVEAATRTAIGGLAAHYLWPEYLTLPEGLREILDRILDRDNGRRR